MPDCLNEVLGLADRLADDGEPTLTADAEYRDAVDAEIPLTMLADATLVPEDRDDGVGPLAFGLRAGGRARP